MNRNQDKTRLFKSESLYIAGDDENEYYIGDKSVGHIGKYKTKERALEVLDEIQKILNLEYTFLHDLSTYVYEMPKE